MMLNGEKSKGHGKGQMSMDMDLSSPYLLPAGLQQSRESFHSLSRSVKDDSDPYRPVTMIKDAHEPYARVRGENSSIYTKSSVGTYQTDSTNAHLIRQQSFPSRGASMARSDSNSPQELVPPPVRFPEASHQSNQVNSPVRSPSPLTPTRNNLQSAGQPEAEGDSYFDRNAQNMRNADAASNQAHSMPAATSVIPPPPPPPPAVVVEPTLPELDLHQRTAPPSPPRNDGLPANPRPNRLQSMEAPVYNARSTSMISDTSDYGDGIKVTPPSPARSGIVEPKPQRHSFDAPMIVSHEAEDVAHGGLTVQETSIDPRRLSMSIRPLPIEDPADNPEQRANRIRSFYKEYFDDSKPEPVGHYGYEDYVEDYGAEYLAGNMYDQQAGEFIYAAATPYAEPVTRRAMTPPPRAPPRFRGAARGHMATGSTGTGRFMPPRGQSAMSARSARKPLPPPSALSSLPTPHKLKEDAMVFNPLDFAPPASFRDRQNGRRPDSPLGTARPYSPSVRAHVPLDSPFQELAPLPSPHLLRKSGTFTALDFAPPPRIKTSDVSSDAASIRSNGSGMSSVQLHSLRAGAYRVSRIPKEVVGTRDDIIESLKPKLNLVSPA